MMNVIGILKDHEPENKFAKALVELTYAPMAESTYNEQLISYLKQGVRTLKFLASDDDADGTPIGQRMYLTDGEWIWPSYYVYYLEKYSNIAVPKIFLDHVHSKKSVPVLSREEMFYAGYMTHKLLTPGTQENKNPPRKIKHLIEAKGEELICY